MQTWRLAPEEHLPPKFEDWMKQAPSFIVAWRLVPSPLAVRWQLCSDSAALAAIGRATMASLRVLMRCLSPGSLDCWPKRALEYSPLHFYSRTLKGAASPTALSMDRVAGAYLRGAPRSPCRLSPSIPPPLSPPPRQQECDAACLNPLRPAATPTSISYRPRQPPHDRPRMS